MKQLLSLRNRRWWPAAVLYLAALPIYAAQPSTTTLAVTAGGNAATSVATGTVVTLTASVQSDGAGVTTGLVNFCDATAPHCTDIHLLGTAQLTPAGTAVVKLRPGIGAKSLRAVFAGTKTYASSSSGISTLDVTSGPTATTISQSGSAGAYTLTATVTGSGSPVVPTGTVSFLDTANANYALASSALGAGMFTQTFAPQIGYDTASGNAHPYWIATGDFNEDGIQDLVVTDESSNLSFLFGKGDGTFAPAVPLTVGVNGTENIAVGDFNGDGHLDLAVTILGGTYNSIVNVLLGNGNGTFAAPVAYAVGIAPQAIVIGDFNGDGIQDLAVVNTDSVFPPVPNGATVSVLLGNGDGTFAASVPYPAGQDPSDVAVGDFNGDGIQDLVVANSDSFLNVLLGNGDGTFTPLEITSVSRSSHIVRVADFNGDGNQDLVVTDALGTLYVLLGNGNGGFEQSAAYAISGFGYITVGDFNLDGIPDIARATQATVQVYLGHGDGTFGAPSSYAAGSDPFVVVAADFNGDGVPDLVATNFFDKTAGVLLNQLTTTAVASATSIAPTGAGTHAAEASYSGDTLYAASISSTTPLTAQPLPTQLVLAVPSQAAYSQPVTLTATLTPDSGENHITNGESVTFYNGATSLGTAVLSGGIATLSVSSLPAGSYSLTASYPGDTDFSASTSAPVSLPVNKATAALSLGSLSQTYSGSALPATATTSPANLPVSFTYNGSTTAPTAAGSYLVVAIINDTNYTGSATGTLAINPATATITLSNLNQTYTGSPLSATATTSPANLSVSFTYNGSATAPTTAGSYTVVATITSGGNYTGTATGTLVINPATATITLGNLTQTYTGSPLSATATTSPAGLQVTFTYGNTGTTAPTTAGIYPVTATVNTGDYTGKATGTLIINQATPSIRWPSPAAITYGTALSGTQLDASSGGVAGSFTYSPAAGVVLNAGTQTLRATFNPTDTTDYKQESGTTSLVVNPAVSTVALSAATLTPTQGQADLLTATVTGAGTLNGSVVFTAGGAIICTVAVNSAGVATCSYTPAAVGAVQVSALYQADPNHTNSNLAGITLNVAAPYDSAIHVQYASTQLVYPGATNVTVCMTPAHGVTATGSVQIFDGTTLLTTQPVQGGGCAYWYIAPGLAAGQHSLFAAYSGDKNNPGGKSAPTIINVAPVPVNLAPSCWLTSPSYGANYQCTVSVSSNAGAAQGVITYSYDGAAAVTVPISNGTANFTLTRPAAGKHTVVIAYAQQTNYAAAGPVTETFTVPAK